MFEQMRNNITRRQLIFPGETVIVGVSGGADSMALLFALRELRKSMEFCLVVAHVHHGIRGGSADEDQAFVRKTAEELELPFRSRRVDVPGYASEHRISIEEAGRILRYDYFHSLLHEWGGGKIAVAHHREDQAETVLLRILRGSGTDGLAGMDFQNVEIIRPLLNISRKEIEEFLAKRGIPYRHDETNDDTVYARNRIRKELIPYLKTYQPQIVNRLWDLSQVAAEDSEFMEGVTESFYRREACRKEGKIYFDVKHVRALSTGARRRLLRYCIRVLKGDCRGFSRVHLIELEQTIKATGSATRDFGGIRTEKSGNSWIVSIEGASDRLPLERQKLCLNGETFLSTGAKIVAKICCVENLSSQISYDRYTTAFDYDRMEKDIFVRSRIPSDSFRPFGMAGRKKIKDFFIDEKVPRKQRDRIPILTHGEEILWIAPYRRSNLYPVTEETKRILKLEYREEPHGWERNEFCREGID